MGDIDGIVEVRVTCYCVWIVGDIDRIVDVRVTCYCVLIVADIVRIVDVRVTCVDHCVGIDNGKDVCATVSLFWDTEGLVGVSVCWDNGG